MWVRGSNPTPSAIQSKWFSESPFVSRKALIWREISKFQTERDAPCVRQNEIVWKASSFSPVVERRTPLLFDIPRSKVCAWRRWQSDLRISILGSFSCIGLANLQSGEDHCEQEISRTVQSRRR
jgi:hypothetical protein